LDQAGKPHLSLAAIEAEVAERDARDTQRRDSPLKWDASYTVIDTTEISAQEAVDLIVESVERSR